MNIPHCFLLVGLLGLLTGCVTPADVGYLFPPEPGYETTPTYTTPAYTTPVYNTSPAYYTTPGYSTMTVYDGYHPGYGGPHYPHRPPPPMTIGRDHDRHGRHGGHGSHHEHGVSSVRPVTSPKHTGSPSRIYPGNSKRTPINQIKPPRQKSMPSKAPSGKGVPVRGHKK